VSDPEATFTDLGPGYYDTRISNSRKMRNHVRQLQALGYEVTLQPTA
jgi:transposase